MVRSKHLASATLCLACLTVVFACSEHSEPAPKNARDSLDVPTRTTNAEPDRRIAASNEMSSPAMAGANDTSDPERLPFDDVRIGEQALDLLDRLDWLMRTGAAVDDERVSQLISRLARMGQGAFGPVRDYLLDDGRRGGQPPELRKALLGILLRLGGPSVDDIALQLLASEPTPMEIHELALYLESVHPGEYSDLILTAAERVLVESDAEAFLPADFFALLGVLGSEETASLLADPPAHREVYAGLALALIPDGGGLATLSSDARGFESGHDTVQGRLALQLLAQQSPEFPEAAAVLIELAQFGVIPHDVWPQILDIVAGNWVLSAERPAEGLVGSHTYQRPEGNQVIYRVALPQSEVERLRNERLFLLDRLLLFAPPGLSANPGG